MLLHNALPQLQCGYSIQLRTGSCLNYVHYYILYNMRLHIRYYCIATVFDCSISSDVSYVETFILKLYHAIASGNTKQL